MVAFVLPWVFLERGKLQSELNWLALAPLFLGLATLLWCVGHFYRAGKGTLAPWDPPKHLVATGLYRYSRNPMYIGVLLILIGWALGFRSRSLAIYTVSVAILFHVRVVFFEEPWLASKHGDAYEQYKHEVRRWLGRR